MTRTGLSSSLSQQRAEPFLEIHPADAADLGLGPATLAKVTNTHGNAVLRVMISDRVARGHPFAPMHWTAGTAPTGRIDALIPGLTDPHSGQPASKSAAVAIAPFAARWFGYAVAARPFRPDCACWAAAPLPGGMQAELAGLDAPGDWDAWVARLFGLDAPQMTFADPARGLCHLAFLDQDRLVAALFIAPEPVALSRSHLAAGLGSWGRPEHPCRLSGRRPRLAAEQPIRSRRKSRRRARPRLAPASPLKRLSDGWSVRPPRSPDRAARR